MDKICITLKKDSAADRLMNQEEVMTAVTTKMLPLHLTIRVGVTVNGRDIT